MKNIIILISLLISFFYCNILFAQQINNATNNDSIITVILNSFREIQDELKNKKFHEITEKYCAEKVIYLVTNASESGIDTSENKIFPKDSYKLASILNDIFTYNRFVMIDIHALIRLDYYFYGVQKNVFPNKSLN